MHLRISIACVTVIPTNMSYRSQRWRPGESAAEPLGRGCTAQFCARLPTSSLLLFCNPPKPTSILSLTLQDAPLSSPPHGVLDPFSRATTGTDTPQRAENRCRRCRRIHPAITSFQHYFRPSICLIAFHPSVLTSHPWCSFSLPPSLQHPRPLLHVLNPSAFPPRLTGAELPPRVGCLESPQEILQVSPPNPRDIVSNQLRTSMPERDVLH